MRRKKNHTHTHTHTPANNEQQKVSTRKGMYENRLAAGVHVLSAAHNQLV